MSSKWKVYRKEDVAKVLKAILQSGFVVAELAELEKKIAQDIEESGYPRRNTGYQLDVLSSFFEQDLTDIFKVKEVWEWFLNELQHDLSEIDVTPKSVAALGSGDRLEISRTIGEIQAEIEEETESLYEEMLDTHWKGLTVEQVTPKLAKATIYVAVLDDNDKLTREPFPAISTTRHPNMQVTAKIELDQTGFRRSRWLHIDFSESIPFKGIGEPMMVRGHQHRARYDDTKTAIITL